MAFEIIVLLVGVVVGLSRKGSFWNLSSLKLNVWWLLPLPYILQHVSVAYLNGVSYELSLVSSYILLLLFCAINFRVPGVVWAAAGTLSNFIAMVSNGLRMPAYIPAVKALAPQILPALKAGTYGKSVAMSTQTHLNFLGDIFSFNVWPVSLLSIGDIVFSIGLIVLIQHAMRTPNGEVRADGIG